MIAKTGTGGGFRGLANYMENENKMKFKETRNLTGDHKDHYIRMMEESASLSSRVEKPVWHLTLSYAETDNPSKKMMLEDADQVLEKMGLDEHQAVIVAHNDEDFEHLHVMVNRVHPVKGKAWNRWNDWDRAKAILRDIEKQRGYREVSEKNWGKGKGLTNGEIHQWKDRGLEGAPLKVRAQLYNFEGAFEKAESWKDIEDFLKEAGCRIKPKYPGGVIEDRSTGKQMKLSRVDRKFSFGELQKEHGNYKEWKAQERARKRELAKKRQAKRKAEKAEKARKEQLARKKEEINNGLRHSHNTRVVKPYNNVKTYRWLESWEEVESRLEKTGLAIDFHEGKPVIYQTETGKGFTLDSWEKGSNKLSDFDAQQTESLSAYKTRQEAGKLLSDRKQVHKWGIGWKNAKKLKQFLKDYQQGREADAKESLRKILNSRFTAQKVIKVFKALAKLSGPMPAVSVGKSLSEKAFSKLKAKAKSKSRNRGKDTGLGL